MQHAFRTIGVYPRSPLSCASSTGAQEKKYKQFQHGGVKGEENPPPITVRTYFRLGLHVKSHSPSVVVVVVVLGVVERNSLFWHGAVGLCH